MNRHPPPPNERLDAEERALAAQLPRAHGRSEPGPELDARILAAAQAAVHWQSPPNRRRRSWIAPVAVAASLVLALGLAWQLRPPPTPEYHAQATDAAAAAPAAGAVVARTFSAPPAPEAQVAQVPAATIESKPAPIPAPHAVVAKQASAPAAIADIAEVAAPTAAPPPPAPPAPPAAVVAQDAAAKPRAAQSAATSAPAPAPAMAMAKAARASDTTRERITVSGTAAEERVEQDEADRAANAAMLDAVGADDPGVEVPPATADSPVVRDAWLRRIGELLEQGHTEDAKASLKEFRRRYPDAELPPELRKLGP
ncbi:hypothetical protein [Thermomonas sp. HDW16]|uniref:hypothetical protein n=1 Tax=Thermomonas sp. HDW16 TaxID=2714945 RepID=UPI001409231B|nr:hypothetical protein [Thermomonas sp. HDW16]QIL20966.1 hypothetical protein G7079_09595 [Thermomonas sp. HDW16]